MRRSLAIASITLATAATVLWTAGSGAAEISLKLVTMMPRSTPSDARSASSRHQEFKGQFRMDWQGASSSPMPIGSVAMTNQPELRQWNPVKC